MAKRSSDDAFSAQHPKKVRRPDEVAVKFLLPNVVVGALLSRKAAALKRIRDQTCYNKDFILKLSGKDQFYPGTKDERMIALVGPPPLVHRACCLLQDQIIDDPFLVTDESGTNDMGPRQGQLKIAVSDRAASKIIGSKGAVVKDISSHFNIAITITPSKEVIVPDERIVTILGPSRNVFDALEPIMYQISQQQTHISPEFDYYAEYSKTKEDENESAKVEEERKDDETEATDGAEKEEAVQIKADEDTSEQVTEEAKPEEAKPEEAKSEEVEVNTEEEEDQEEEKPSESENKPESEDKHADKKESTEEKMKKLLKDPRKDGRWVWQSDRNNRPKWAWVESQKNPSHYNHSSQGYRGNRGGSRTRGGRHWN